MRLFTAIQFTDTVRQRMVMLAENIHGFKWASPDQVHLTLRFIGNVEPQLSFEIDKKLQKIHFSAFKLTPAGIGMFPNSNQPRIFWIGIEADKALFALQKRIENAIIECGLKPEIRNYHPHITLARIRSSNKECIQSFMKKHEHWRMETITIHSFHLVESIRNRSGSVYQNLFSYPAGYVR